MGLGSAEIMILLGVLFCFAAPTILILAFFLRRGPTTRRGGLAPVEDRLRKLDALREQGLVTEQEYRERRSQILGDM